MIAVIAKITAQEGKGAEVVAAFQTLVAAVEQEEGTVRYVMHTDASNADVIYFYEQYADRAALEAHGKSDTMKEVGKGLRELTVSRPEITILDIVGGKSI